jgi:4-hydroxybenzoate polyprenyltransferase
MSSASAILRTLRPQQWVKNLFVVAPLVFSKHLFDPSYALLTAAATAAFCALSGAVYTFNDLRDAGEDRLHPVKKHRPIAAGELGERTAAAVAVVLIAVAIGGCLALSWKLAATAAGYVTVNLAYSFALKRVAWVDVLMIAGGFLLRVAAGAFAIDVEISPWLLVCTGLLAAMLGFGKRAHELLLATRDGRDPASTRVSLGGYSLPVLRLVMAILAAATSAAYALYTRDARTVAFFQTGHLIWTLPFAIIGIARFLQLALWNPRPISPTDAILRDWPFMVNMAAWGATVLGIIYGAR